MLLLVEKPKFLEGEVLSQNLGPRRLKFRFEGLLWIPPQTEVTMELLHTLSLKLMVLKETGPFQLKLFTRWAPQVLKCSAQNFKKFEIIPEEKSVNKMKFANQGVRCSQQNSEVQVHQICQGKLASGLKFQRKIKSCSQFEVYASMATKWQKTTYEVGSIEVKNTAVRCLSFFKFTAEVFQQYEVHQTTKSNETKWSTMAILSYPEVFKTVTGSAVEKCVHTYEVWNSTFVHMQYEVNQHGQRDRWSQAPWGVCEVLPLWCTWSSHRMDSKFQIPSWLKQHQKQQVPEWKEIEVEHVSSSWKFQT